MKASQVGRWVYGLAAIAVGAVNLVWGDFATIWQPIQAFGDRVPGRQAFAYVTAAALVLCGIAILGRKTARAGALGVAAVNAIFAAFWLPRVVGYPQIFGVWSGFAEALAPVAGGVMLFAMLSGDSHRQARTAQTARYIFGVCAIAFAIGHFSALAQTASLVPKWIPPGQTFWALTTGIFHLLAGLAILSGILDLLASRLLALMLIVFGALVWLPQLFEFPHDQSAWAGNAVNLSMIGTAWVIADWIAKRRNA